MPTDREVVETAASAAADLIFARIDRSDVEDYDVTVSFEEGTLDVDVYVLAPDSPADADRVAEDAALAARHAVDELFEDGDEE
ncbi:MAG: hypothetical protein ACI9YT_001237 [Halobacteriales archaeon]|jgi:hypothetical protein